jgi:hypothetical protein
MGAAAVPASAEQARPAAPDPEIIRQREQQRVTCLTTTHDYDALEKMTSPTLTYSHSSAALDTKETWLASLRSGNVKFGKIAHRDVQVRFVTPEVAILNALPEVEVTVGGQLQRMTLRVTVVYVLKDGVWLFEAWQASRKPE